MFHSAGNNVRESYQDEVFAIIVTYNPDLDRLRENVEAISCQARHVLLFDNGSHSVDQIEALCIEYGCILKKSGRNLGLAIALNNSCEYATSTGASLALLLDQDSVASTNMVSGMLESFDEKTALVSPRVVDRNKGDEFLSSRDVEVVRRAITSGMLLRLDVWREIGGFDERLFVDWVDYELSAAVRERGYLLKRNNSVSLLHEMGKRELAISIPLYGGRKLALYRTNHSLDRLEDKARSWRIVVGNYGFSKIGCEEFAYIGLIMVRDLAIERNRGEIVKAFAKGRRSGKAALCASPERKAHVASA